MKAIKLATNSDIDAMLNSSMAVILLNHELIILQANNACQPLFGCARELLIGQSIFDIFKLHRAAFPFTTNELANNAEANKSFTSIFKLHNQPEKNIPWELQPYQSNGLIYLLTASLNNISPKLHIIDSAPKSLSQNVIEMVSSVSRQAQGSSQFVNTINSIIQGLPGCAHLKSVQGFNYQATNHATLKLLGMREASDLIGKDDYDIAKLMSWKWPSHFAQELQDYDSRVMAEQTPIIALEEKPYLNSEGNLVINSLTKIPLFYENRPFGVLTFATDISKLKSIFNIRILYKQLYNNSDAGHEKFIDYLGLPTFLHANQSLTEREFEVLFAYCRGISAKVYAREHMLSPRTIEKRLELIKEKFIKFDKNHIIELILLRGHNEVINGGLI